MDAFQTVSSAFPDDNPIERADFCGASCNQKLKELHLTEEKMPNLESEKNASQKLGRKMAKKIITRVNAKAPTSSSCELPILYELLKDPQLGIATKIVLQEVRSAKWFGKLTDDDKNACYPGSKKKIVDSVIKF